MKTKLIHSGVDWKKVSHDQSKNWAAKSGPVTVTQNPKLCKTRKHDWEGDYEDGWLKLNCLICKVKNVSYQLSKRELECIENGWWGVNDLYIRVDRKGNVLDPKGRKKVSKKMLDSLPQVDPFNPNNLVKVIEEYTPPVKKSGKLVKNEDKFFLPPIPWKWTVYSGFDVVTYGYTHTEEHAHKMADQAINQYRPSRA